MHFNNDEQLVKTFSKLDMVKICFLGIIFNNKLNFNNICIQMYTQKTTLCCTTASQGESFLFWSRYNFGKPLRQGQDFKFEFKNFSSQN